MRKMMVLALGSLLAQGAFGATIIIDEQTGNTDLIGDSSSSADTDLGTLFEGEYSVLGQVGDAAPGFDNSDYFTFTVGGSLAQVFVTVPDLGNGNGNTRFGVRSGSPWDSGVDWFAETGILVGTTALQLGGDLGPGVYTVKVFESSVDKQTYQFDIKVVPEPGTYALVGLGLIGVALIRRRRRA